jgi:hypothetical protein
VNVTPPTKAETERLLGCAGQGGKIKPVALELMTKPYA